MLILTRGALPICLLVTLAGCASPYYQVHRVERGGQMLVRDASLSIGVMKSPGSELQLCLQGAPDATFNQSSGFTINASLLKYRQGDEEKSETSREAEMVGRSSALLYAREVFYRACETALSTNASPQEWRDLFSIALQASAEIMKLEATNTKIEIREDQVDENTSSYAPASQPSAAAPK